MIVPKKLPEKRHILFTLIILPGLIMSAGLFLAGAGNGRAERSLSADFNQLPQGNNLQTLLALRRQAIEEAKAAGDYRCCIDPPCTMCYLEANKWNNFTAGTCACDDLIGKGEEACPQCEQGAAEAAVCAGPIILPGN